MALSQAASSFTATLGAAQLPGDQLHAAQAVAGEGGPLAANGLPPGTPGSAAHQIPFEALGHGYAIGYVVCGICAAVAALLTVVALRGGRSDNVVEQEALLEAETVAV